MHRARARIADGRPRFEADASRDAALVDSFFAALEAGDVDGLASVLADDVVFYGDGGGKAPAVRHPLLGAVAVARFLAGLVRRGEGMGVHLDRTSANGEAALRVSAPDGATLSVLMVHVDGGRVSVRRQPAESREAAPPRPGRRPQRPRVGFAGDAGGLAEPGGHPLEFGHELGERAGPVALLVLLLGQQLG